jgi:large subunit ribosomal protein L21
MYAVIRTGGKQYRVQEGDVIEVDHLSVKGNRVSFTPVLVVTDEGKTIFGRKDLKAYTVGAKVVGDAKGDKINVLKYRPKSGYAVRTGHRQLFSLIEIASIGERGAKKAKVEEGAEDSLEAPEAPSETHTSSETENASEAEGE